MDNPDLRFLSRDFNNNTKTIQSCDCIVKNYLNELQSEKQKEILYEQNQKQHEEIKIKKLEFQLEWLYSLKDGIFQLKKKIISSLNKSLEQILQKIKYIQLQKEFMNKQYFDDQQTSLNNYQKSYREIDSRIINKLLGLKENIINLDFLYTSSKITRKPVSTNERNNLDQSENFQNIENQLITQESKEFKIFDFAYDKNSNCLIVTKQQDFIKIYSFYFEEILEIICNQCVHNFNFTSQGKFLTCKFWKHKSQSWGSFIQRQLFNTHKGYLTDMLTIQNKTHQSKLQYLNSLNDEIIKYKEAFILTLSQISQFIILKIKYAQSQTQQSDTLEDSEQQMNQLDEFFLEVQNQISNLLTEFKQQFMNIDHLILMSNQNIKQSSIQKFQYQLIQKEVSKQELYAFAFDTQNNILIATGEEGYVLIYEFKNGKIEKLLQSCKQHSSVILCLCFFTKTKCFVTGSDDLSLKIWDFDETNKKIILKQKLEDHKDSIICVIINSEENILISGSYDSSVKFWRKENEVWSLYQSIDVGFKVQSLSLNESEDKLIICGMEQKINVLKIDQNQYWKTFKVIITNEVGYRLCFTIGSQFVFQPRYDKYLEVYDFDDKIKEFYLKQKLRTIRNNQCDELFPCQFIKNCNILTVKHGEYLNIFQVCQSGDYEWIQAISFKSCFVYGKITDDGEYLVTRELKSKEIQVRKLIYLDQT